MLQLSICCLAVNNKSPQDAVLKGPSDQNHNGALCSLTNGTGDTHGRPGTWRLGSCKCEEQLQTEVSATCSVEGLGGRAFAQLSRHFIISCLSGSCTRKRGPDHQPTVLLIMCCSIVLRPLFLVPCEKLVNYLQTQGYGWSPVLCYFIASYHVYVTPRGWRLIKSMKQI